EQCRASWFRNIDSGCNRKPSWGRSCLPRIKATNAAARHTRTSRLPRLGRHAPESSVVSRQPSNGNFSMIETRDQTKTYGDLYALNRRTLKLEKGDVYGFIGPNGAGKTTTMRLLATLLNPSWGEASVCGYSIYTGSKDIRRVIGYMPDFFGVYDDMNVIEYLEFFAAAYRIKGPERRKKGDQVLDLVDLGYKRDALVTSLSRGMTQRLGRSEERRVGKEWRWRG